MFRMEIFTGGSAFRDENCWDENCNEVLDPHATEVRRLLREVHFKLDIGETSGILIDINGNRVGSWKYE